MFKIKKVDYLKLKKTLYRLKNKIKMEMFKDGTILKIECIGKVELYMEYNEEYKQKDFVIKWKGIYTKWGNQTVISIFKDKVKRYYGLDDPYKNEK